MESHSLLMKDQNIRIGIIGTGGTTSIAEKHLAALLKDNRATVSAVYNRHLDSASLWIRNHGLKAKACESYDELLSLVDGVIICTPNSSHCPFVKKAIESNKHFLVEKPLGVNLEECEEVFSLCKTFDGIKMIGFTYRFYSLVNEAKRICRERIGKIYTLNAYFGGRRLSDPNIGVEWRMKRDLSGSGALGDFGSHLLDLALFVTGEHYNSIYAVTETMINERKGEIVDNDDSSSFICGGKNNFGSFTVSRIGMDDLRLVVTGEGGMIDLSMRGNGSLTYWEKSKNGPYSGKIEVIEGNTDNPYEKEIKTFLDGIEGKEVSYPNMDDALYVSKLLFAAEESSREKKEVSIS